MHISSKWFTYPPSSTNCFRDASLPNMCQFLEQQGIGSVELLCCTRRGQTLACCWPRQAECLGSQRSPGRPDIHHEGNIRDAEAGHSKDKQEADWTENFGWKSPELIQSLWPSQEAVSTQEEYRKVKRDAGTKLEGSKPTQNLSWLLL